ncbi:MAG: RNA polymerase factor sigma-54 [Bacteroidia bacterium]|jgi:RNA polymerase sigma-54 factor|nr:RNA polymerase factor sigma-54 [Bacteroidia bacterium]
MALRQSQHLKLLQKLSPQQIQVMKLLQLPTVVLEQKIKEELELNPALEEDILSNTEELETDYEEVDQSEVPEENDFEEKQADKIDDDYDIEDYMGADEIDSYKYEISNSSADDDYFQAVAVEGPDFRSQLEEQLGLRDISEEHYTIGLYLIGCIDEDGYIRRDLDLIVDDLAFTQNISTTLEKLTDVLTIIQEFDPPGVGSRNLQECLLIQLERKKFKTRETHLAIEVIKTMMEEFSRKHYDKILRKLKIEEDDLKDIITEITQLNPRPGNSENDDKNQITEIVPDFNITVIDGIPELSINQRNLPELKISAEYINMLKEYSRVKEKTGKEAVGFIKNKIETAQWFIEALQQRHTTLLVSMHAIMMMQYAYFATGDESKIKPMILRDIAEKVDLDISTISRVVNSKYVQTPYGTFLLKTFFSESLSTESGEDASAREVKKIMQECIASEDKKKPLTDDVICNILKEKNYHIARRTVAKYREQLDIPVARMRREI